MEYVYPGYSSFEAAGAWHAVRSSTPHRSRNKSQLTAFCGRKWARKHLRVDVPATCPECLTMFDRTTPWRDHEIITEPLAAAGGSQHGTPQAGET